MQKYRDIAYIAIITILSIFLFRTCDNLSGKETEIDRLEYNSKVKDDTIRHFITENGNHGAEILAYKLDKNKDKALIDSISKGFQKKKGTLIAIAKTNSSIEVSKTGVKVKDKKLSDTSGILTINDTVLYDSSNYTNIGVRIPYQVKGNILTTDKASYNVNTSLDILLRFQEFNNSIKIIAETPHQNVTFHSMTGGILQEDNIPKSMKMSMRREWGLGLSLSGGLGYNPNTKLVVPVVTIGVGINFSPKKLQFR